MSIGRRTRYNMYDAWKTELKNVEDETNCREDYDFIMGFGLAMATLNAQNLLAVMDLQGDGRIAQNTITAVSDKISATCAKDTLYMIFDRTMIPELLKQLSVEQSAASCFEVQCLALIGSLIGANTIIGGSIARPKGEMVIKLNYVDVAAKKLINTVSFSSGSSSDVLIDQEIPALTESLVNPDARAPVAASTGKKRNLMRNPLTYAGAMLVIGAGAGAYYYKYRYRSDDDADDAAGPSVESTEIPINDVPERTRGK